MRYYDECRDPTTPRTLARRPATSLPSTDPCRSSGLRRPGRRNAVGPAEHRSDPTVGDPARSFALTVPSYGGCGQDYLPIGVQVRLVEQQRRPEPVVRRPDHGEVRRLLHADLAVSRLQRRERGLAAAAHERTRARWMRPQPPRRLLRPASRGPEQLSLRRVRRSQLGNARRRPAGTFQATSPSARTGSTCRAPAGRPAACSPTRARRRTDRRRRREQHPHHARLGRQRQLAPGVAVRLMPAPSAAATGASTTRQQDAHQAFVGTTTHGGCRRARPDVAEGSCSSPSGRGSQAGRSRTSTRRRRHATVTDTIYPTVGIRSVAQGRHPHDAAPRRPAGEPDAPLRPELRAGPGVQRLPIRLSAVVRQECAGPAPGGTRRRRHARSATSSSRTPTWASPFGQNSPQQLWQCVPTAPGLSTGQVGDDIGVATEELHQHQQQLVPAVRVRLRRQLRREAEPAEPGRPRLAVPDGQQPGPTRSRRPAGRQPVHHPVPVAQGIDRRRSAGDRADPRLRVVLCHELDGQQHQPERPVPGPRLRPRRLRACLGDRGPRPAARRDHRRLRRDRRLRVRPGRRDRDLRRRTS